MDLVEVAGGGGGVVAGLGAGFGDVAGKLGGFAQLVELLGVLGAELLDGMGEPGAGDLAGASGAELDFVGWEKGFFELVEGCDEVGLVFGKGSMEAGGLVVALAGEGFDEVCGVGGGGEFFEMGGVDVQVADSASGPADGIGGLAEEAGLLLDFGGVGEEGEELEEGFEAAGGGADSVDGLRFGLVEAVLDGGP